MTNSSRATSFDGAADEAAQGVRCSMGMWPYPEAIARFTLSSGAEDVPQSQGIQLFYNFKGECIMLAPSDSSIFPDWHCRINRHFEYQETLKSSCVSPRAASVSSVRPSSASSLGGGLITLEGSGFIVGRHDYGCRFTCGGYSVLSDQIAPRSLSLIVCVAPHWPYAPCTATVQALKGLSPALGSGDILLTAAVSSIDQQVNKLSPKPSSQPPFQALTSR
jgi:hypothetical protein